MGNSKTKIKVKCAHCQSSMILDKVETNDIENNKDKIYLCSDKCFVNHDALNFVNGGSSGSSNR